MPAETSLRDRKKQLTRRVISEAAISLFLARGFAEVSVADVAEAANVSRPTVFNYFPTKEDLVLHRFRDHVDELARVVRQRPPGVTPMTVLRDWFLAELGAHHPTTGLCDDPAYLAFQRMVLATPSLRLRILDQAAESEDALGVAFREALRTASDDPTPHLAACQVVAVHRALVLDNVRWLAAGGTIDERQQAAVRAAGAGFELLEQGLGRLAW